MNAPQQQQASAQPTVQFGARSGKGLRASLAAAALAVTTLVSGCTANSGQIDTEVTQQDVFEIDGKKDWDFGRYHFDIHETQTGFVIQGKDESGWSNPFGHGYKFHIDEEGSGWKGHGKKDYTVGDYRFEIKPEGQGWRLKGDKQYDVLNGFEYTATPTATGWDIQGKKQMDFFGDYKFRVTQVDGGWDVKGGHNWSLKDFSYFIDEQKTGINSDKVEGMLVSIPAILAMIHDNEESEKSNNN